MENDVLIIQYYLREELEYYKHIHKLPLTNTGRVRTYVKNKCFYTNTDHKKSSKGKFTRYKMMMADMKLTPKHYKMLNSAFQGGFTHGNAHYIEDVIPNVSSIDFTSSYPSVMICEKFPMSSGIDIDKEDLTLENLEVFMREYCVVFTVKFEGLSPKFENEDYLSSSKCFGIVKPIINNGRVHSAESICTTITDVDYKIMKQCYNWENIYISSMVIFNKGYLPKPIIESILDFYEDKTMLKGVKGKEVEYMRAKGMLNSIYGMGVTNIVRDGIDYFNSEWIKITANLNIEIDDYNNKSMRFLYYAWGIWVTAYSRANLWTGILNINDDYIYSDTDSIKLTNYEKYKPFIKAYDKRIEKKLHDMCDLYRIDRKRVSPLGKTIGVWDYEGTSDLFKTLGAKRYMGFKNGELEITVAGLSKKNGRDYLLEKSGGDIEKAFELFNDDLYVPKDKTGKMTHTYIDSEMKMLITDYKGVSATVNTKSGIHLENVEFTLSLSKQFTSFLNDFVNGYVLQISKSV